MVKLEWQTRRAARNQECVALGVKRACHRVSELEPLAVCKTLALYQRLVARAALMETCIRGTLAGSPRLHLTGTVFYLPLSLPCEMHH